MESLRHQEKFSFAKSVNRQLEEIKQNGLPPFDTSIDHKLVADAAIEGVRKLTEEAINNHNKRGLIPDGGDVDDRKAADEEMEIVADALDGVAPLIISSIELYPQEYDRTALDSMDPYFEDYESRQLSWSEWMSKTALEVRNNASIEKLAWG